MAPCGYLTTSLSGRIVKVNKTLTEWLGYGCEEMTGGKRFIDLMTVGGRIFYETHITPLMRVEAAVAEIALDLIHKNGCVLPVLINGRQKRNAADEPVVNRFMIFNATERRTYERELLAARDLLSVTLTSIGDGVVTTDGDGRINFMNPVAEELTAWKTDEARGRRIDEVLVLIREDDSATVENPIIHALRSGTTVGTLIIPCSFPKMEGAFRWTTAPRLFGTQTEASSAALSYFGIFPSAKRTRDWSANIRSGFVRPSRLESLGRMAGGIAHDFNNLLTGILGNAGLLADSVVSADTPKVNDILDSAERAASLTKQILAYSGGGWLEKKSLDLNSLVRESAAPLRASLSAQIESNVGPPTVVINADPGQTQQIIKNLVINASEAMPEGKGTIAIRTNVVEKMTS